MQKGISSVALTSVIVILLIASGGIYYATRDSSDIDTGPVACTADAKICPDGSAVGRIGPKCEFAPCPTEPTNDVMMESDDTLTNDESMMQKESYSGTLLAGSLDTSPLLEFTKSDYDTAIATDKLVVLYFYANWCPVCKTEFPKMQSAFNELEGNDVVAFRVNFNDTETDQNEKVLAQQFGVAYQHTKVFIKNNTRVLKSPESWDASRYLSEIASHR